MISNKQSSRAYTAFLVTWSFVVLTVTGLVLYVVPQGRVASWIHWSFGGLGRDGWSDVHILFGALFIATGILHLYFNWKPFKNYLAERVRGQLALKRELVTSTATTLVLVVLAILHVPPGSWLFDLNDAVKASWAQGPGNEPPFGHAEEAPLPTLAQRTGIDLPAGLAALRAAGLRVDDQRAPGR